MDYGNSLNGPPINTKEELIIENGSDMDGA